ncbi:MAG: hypothetical protein ABIW38_04600 [Ferruginibacter sp.]
MQNNQLKTIFAACLFFFSTLNINAQYKQFSISAKGDTINGINQKDEKQGKWVIKVAELRGEPGYEEEGLYKKGLKHGVWRKYNPEGDIIAVENYKNGGKDGLQQYFTYLGDLVLEENWKGYDPDAPYDTIAVYGTGSGEIIDYKIVKAEQYSVKNGEWKFYEPGTGRLIKTEQWERNNLVLPGSDKSSSLAVKDASAKKPEKTAQMLEWEKKNKGKKKVVRDGRTGL